LCEPFAQESQESVRSHQGAGLGLVLVKRYVESNRARIEVRSIKQVGTAFTISFAQESANRSMD
jgi:signal transduction histidine kinase